MSDYTADYIDIVADYWYDGKIIDRYSTAEYNKIIYPEYEKGAILRNGIKMGNINDRFFETQRKTPRNEFYDNLYSDTGRGVGEKDGTAEASGSNGVYSDDGRARKGNGELRGSGVSQGTKYALSTDSNNAELDDYV